MKCSKCRHENPTGAKFCEECATPLARACPKCGSQVSSTAKFCPECAHPLLAPATEPRFTSPESYTPRHLAERILASKTALAGERKVVTVLFADLKGSTELLADRDPEQARTLLDSVLEHMMEAVHRYEGTVNQVMGDGIMALFGAPVAHEDHAVRACYAALRMQEVLKRHAEGVLRSHGVPLRIRVGLNSGEVVVRTIASDLRIDYSAIGQTTHLAARMEQLADPGTVLLAPATVRLAEGYVDTMSRGPVPIKGISEPVEVFELTGVGVVRSRLQVAARRGLTRLTARESELDQLRLALERAGLGQGEVVAVIGEPGVGKSRLCWEFLHSKQTEGWQILESRAVSYGKSSAYLPVIDLVKAHCGVEAHDDRVAIREKVAATIRTLDRHLLEPSMTALLSLLGVRVEDAVWEQLAPFQRRQQTLDGVKRLLLRASQMQPLVLFFEDLHWIDTETQAVLDSLVESLPAARVLLMVNYRPEYRHDWTSKTYYRQVRIDPLETGGAEDVLADLLGGDEHLAPLKQMLIERTGGNPLFLEESVRSLVETGALVREGAGYRLGEGTRAMQVPATVQAILAARIDRLPAGDKQLLQAAAVVGMDVPFAEIAAIADLPEVDLRGALARLRAAEFLYEARLFPDLELTFKHPLTHEVAYSGILFERRRTLHATLVESIERLHASTLGDHVEQLSRHAEVAELWDRAVDYHRAAAATAWARGVLAEAVTFGERALELSERLGENAENVARRIDARLGLHGPLFAIGQLPRLIELHRDAERMARETNDRRRLGAAAFRLSSYLAVLTQYEAALRYADQALEIASDLGDVDLKIVALYARGQADGFRGHHRDAMRSFEQVVDGADAERAHTRLGMAVPPYVMACAHLATSLASVGEFDRALVYVDRARTAADRLEHPAGRTVADVSRAGVLVQRGEFAKALTAAERAVEVAQENQLMMWFPGACVIRGRGLVGVGEIASGLASIEQGVAMAESLGVTVATSPFLSALAEALLAHGRPDDARQAAETALAVATAAGELTNEAQALLLCAEASSGRSAPAYRVALDLYERARAIARDTELRPLLAHCDLGRGRALRALGDAAAGRTAAAAALDSFTAMGMRTYAERTREEFPDLG